LYGSPNNLALYLERTLGVALALAVFVRMDKWRLIWGLHGRSSDHGAGADL
ncbi:MAG: hypothetical protein HC802_02165, partial [Caldilineaceae bacterium]|nr:hypothetical protein [Caldilineaceae bacterium]